MAMKDEHKCAPAQPHGCSFRDLQEATANLRPGTKALHCLVRMCARPLRHCRVNSDVLILTLIGDSDDGTECTLQVIIKTRSGFFTRSDVQTIATCLESPPLEQVSIVVYGFPERLKQHSPDEPGQSAPLPVLLHVGLLSSPPLFKNASIKVVHFSVFRPGRWNLTLGQRS